jgi:zinc protease
MKKLIILTSLIFALGVQAQTDRTMPKPGPAPKVNIGKPQNFTLSNGLKVMVVENSKLPRVSFNLEIDNNPFAEGDKKGIDDLTGAMIGKGTKTISKDAFNEEIDFIGARIYYSSNGAYASGLSKYTDRILELMVAGFLDPNFTQEELDKEKAQLIDGLKTEEKSVTAVMERVGNFLAFGKNHPKGEYLSEKTINNVSLSDIKQHYNTYFVPQNAYLVVVGDVKFNDIKTKIETAFESWTKSTAPQLSYSDPKNVQFNQINFVDMPNAVQSEISLINIVNLKMTDPDYFAAIVANQVLGGDFSSYLNMNLREKHGWTYGARSNINGSKYVTKFKAASQVRNMVTDSAVVEFMNELRRIRKEKVTEETLKNVKAGYIGKFVMQIQKPETVASYALTTETQKLPADFYENYIKSINAVTADDVLKAANKYFLAENTRIVIVGKGSDVIPGLEKLKIPIFYFDKYGMPTKKAEEKKAAAGVTVKTVIDKYIEAIGGQKVVSQVKTTLSKASATIQGIPMEMVAMRASTGKLKVEMKGMGMTMMKQLINEKEAYIEQQGQRKVLEGEMLKEIKTQAHPFPELALATKEGVSLLPIQAIDGKDAYGVKDGKMTYFFDVASGLKVATATIVDAGGQSITQNINYGDYKEVSGVKIPFKTTMNVGFDILLTTSEVKINEGVTDADFQ